MTRLEKQLRVKVPVARLWPLISDTERLNRTAGMRPVQYRVEKTASGPANVFAQSQMGLMRMRWQELPFEWVENDHYHALRRFTNGPLKVMKPGMTFSSQNGSTEIRIFFEFEPRNALGGWIARHVIWPGVLKKFEKMLRGMESHLLDNAPNPLAETASKAQAQQERLQTLTARLLQRNVPADLVDLLAGHLMQAPDLDVVAMRPFALADRWSRDRVEVLKMFLHATREGLLDLSWEILCPGCRKSEIRTGSLAELAGKAHCDYCQIRYDAEFDRSVEARFTVHPSVRKTQRNEFCMGGPANTPHILAQVLVAAGENRRVALHALGVPLRVRSPQISGSVQVRVLDIASSSECVVTLENGNLRPATAEVKVGQVQFDLKNLSGEERWFIIERERWDHAVATAAQVTSLQEFRDMFSSEVLAPGEEIAVRSLTFLFTDLAGSTATYHNLGDAKAYSMVREHFVVLKEAIAKNEGAVVKTIGDAVMAVFTSPEKGVLAAVDMQRGIRKWNASRADKVPITLKIGLHEGAAIAVNADDILDYFGTSVNLAARIESLSVGGDIVLSENVMQAVEASKLVEQISEKREKLESPVKGFPQPIRAWRIWPKAPSP